MKNFTKVVFTLMLIALSSNIFAQGVTTSSMNGKVTDANGPLPGANVVAIHVPSGTKYGSSTDFDGFYRMSNMRVGGPYQITITYVGYQEFKESNIYLNLGESRRLSVTLQESANALDEVVIVGSATPEKDGAATKVGRKQIDALPTLSRSIADFARLTPQAQVNSNGAISISGQNNRFNSIYLDGAVNNDVFGLSSSGTNGGSTGVSPISLDAVESFQINVSPFDVKQSGFAGGSINAVTRSGTNELSGSVYSLYRDESLAGKTPVDLLGTGDTREKLPEFRNLTYGARLGGAIIKDKLFYFVNYERQDNEAPTSFLFNNYNGNASEADLANLSNFLIDNYGYNPRGYTQANNALTSNKLIAKIDWNINDNHKLSLKHSYVGALADDPASSNSGAIRFQNGAVIRDSKTNTTSLELSSNFGSKYSNNLVIGYTKVVDDRGFAGNPFPNVEIQDGGGRIFFGSEAFSTANLLETSVLTFTDNFEIYSGRHKVTIGTHNEFTSVKNLFFGRNFGYYRFSSLNDFLTGVNANRYRLGYSLLGGNGDSSLGAAEFDSAQIGFYVQDEVDVTDRLKITGGLRFDVPFYSDGLANDNFNTDTVPLLLAAGKDLKGAQVGNGIAPTVHVSPRLGFNWDILGNKKTVIRGGLGVFVSRIPAVWPGGVYNNNGLTAGSLDIRDGSVAFNPDVNSQFTNPAPGSGATGGVVDLFSSDFQLPQLFKVNLAIDQKLPKNFNFSADLLLNETIRGIQYENLNLAGPEYNTNETGSRPVFNNRLIDGSYPGIYLASNTSQGHSWNISGTLGKNYYNDFIDIRAQVTYSYGDSYVLNDATSSQNSSQWENVENVRGANNLDLSRSDFSQGHRVLSQVSIDLKWNKSNKTTLGLFYNGNEGNVFSYVYNDFGNIADDTGRNTSLIYVPQNASEINLIDTSDLSAADQWTALNAFIEGDEYLSSRRGRFAERNGDRNDWSHIVDFKFTHEIRFNKNALEFTADIFNFTNLLNKEWGNSLNSGSRVSLIDFEGFEADGRTPQYSYDPSNIENSLNQPAFIDSRWRMQLGLRYKFN